MLAPATAKRNAEAEAAFGQLVDEFLDELEAAVEEGRPPLLNRARRIVAERHGRNLHNFSVERHIKAHPERYKRFLAIQGAIDFELVDGTTRLGMQHAEVTAEEGDDYRRMQPLLKLIELRTSGAERSGRDSILPDLFNNGKKVEITNPAAEQALGRIAGAFEAVARRFSAGVAPAQLEAGPIEGQVIEVKPVELVAHLNGDGFGVEETSR